MSVSPDAKPTMAGKTKRKWRWSSKSLFAPTVSQKAVKLDHSMLDNHDGVAEYNVTKEFSMDGCSTEDFEHRSGVAAKMRRNGSKLLSIVGIQRGNWLPLESDAHRSNKYQIVVSTKTGRQPSVIEKSLWLSSKTLRPLQHQPPPLEMGLALLNCRTGKEAVQVD